MNNKVEVNNSPAEAAKGKGKKDTKQIINLIVNVILVVAIILAAISTYVSFVSTSGNGVPSILGVSVLSIQTDSMYPTLKMGDLIVDTTVKDASKLRPGDIITFWTNIEGNRVLNTHRISQVYQFGDNLKFVTSGDKYGTLDPIDVHESEIIGKYQFHIPGLGKVVDYLQTPTGFFILVIIPVLIFFIFHLVQFFRVLFEYQNVKMLIKYEQERGRAEDLIETQIKDEKERDEIRRAAIEAELREKLKAELLADLEKQNASDANKNENTDKTEQ